MLAADGRLWAVCGGFVYRFASNGVPTLVGPINTALGRVSMAANSVEILIVDGNSGYLVDFETSGITAVSDVDFPSGVTQAVFLDGYFIVSADGSGRFYVNEVADDGSGWNGTDFATAEGSTDSTLAIAESSRELFIFGENSTEVWLNTGNASFPFERAGVAFIERGIAARWSLAKLDGGLFWLGTETSAGSGIVYRMNGYSPERISTHAIEHFLSGLPDISDSYAVTYAHDGHPFYALTLPSGDRTFVYDVATGAWHERAKFMTADGSLSAWTASHHVHIFGKHLVSDITSGVIYELRDDTYTDAGDPILRLRSSPVLSEKQVRMFFAELRLRMESGSDSNSDSLISLRFSDNGGHTWSSYLTTPLSVTGRYGVSPVWRRLGAGRNRVFEISMNSPVRFALLSATVEGVAGGS
jgi:hypothetical protein